MSRYSACIGDTRNVALLRLHQWCKKCCVTQLASVTQEMSRYSTCISDARNVALLHLHQWRKKCALIRWHQWRKKCRVTLLASVTQGKCVTLLASVTQEMSHYSACISDANVKKQKRDSRKWKIGDKLQAQWKISCSAHLFRIIICILTIIALQYLSLFSLEDIQVYIQDWKLVRQFPFTVMQNSGNSHLHSRQFLISLLHQF